jgi:hypothetical protein
MIVLLIVTLTSVLLAAIMSAIAWRMSGDERRRSEARIAALAAEIHDGLELTPASHLFAERPTGAGSRAFVVIGGGALVFGAAMAIAILAGGRFPRALRSVHPGAATAPAAPPLELVALGHERDGDRLTVRGIVRNPPAGTGIDQLTAVVLLFTPDGGFVASGRAAVESSALRPGGESPFAVTVPGVTVVGKYRVSFRTDEHVVPHLDRRHDQS